MVNSVNDDDWLVKCENQHSGWEVLTGSHRYPPPDNWDSRVQQVVATKIVKWRLTDTSTSHALYFNNDHKQLYFDGYITDSTQDASFSLQSSLPSPSYVLYYPFTNISQ